MSPLPALCTDKSLEGEKRLGDYSFVSDVISVAVLFDLPCPVRAHQSLPPVLIHYFLTSSPYSNASPSTQPTNPPLAHKHAFTFFPSELHLFQSLTQKAQTQTMNKKLTIWLNAIQVDP